MRGALADTDATSTALLRVMEAEFEGAVMEVSETKERVQSGGGRRPAALRQVEVERLKWMLINDHLIRGRR